MKHLNLSICLCLLLFTGCEDSSRSTPKPKGKGANAPKTLLEMRNFHITRVVAEDEEEKYDFDEPPEGVFELVEYPSAVGNLGAYVTPDPKDGKKHPAIIWITGGDCNSIGNVWHESKPENEQTASAYRKAGMVMMFPSLRGGNTNPGRKESFYGEVEDVMAAGEYVKKLPYVDPDYVYLGGHSTGGTLVLLVAECSDQFRAIFSFGPVADPRGYGPDYFPLDNPNMNEEEVSLRAPGEWLHSITSPTFVIEGSGGRGNADEVAWMVENSNNRKITFLLVDNADHFSVLHPTNTLIAEKILVAHEPMADRIDLDLEELQRLFP